jgi:ribose 5-phosphate isomerase B
MHRNEQYEISFRRMRKVVIGSDHGGVGLKDQLVAMLGDSYEIVDLGTQGTTPIDYPKIAEQVASQVTRSASGTFGILVCGSGIGVSISANKVKGIRCALVHDAYTARMSRQHNDANVIALGERVTGVEVAKEAVKIFLETPFEGGRHANRVALITDIESRGC